MSDQQPKRDTWALVPMRQLPRQTTPQFWTGQDYTQKPEQALTFTSQSAIEKYLRSHRHLAGKLQPAELLDAEPAQQPKIEAASDRAAALGPAEQTESAGEMRKEAGPE